MEILIFAKRKDPPRADSIPARGDVCLIRPADVIPTDQEAKDFAIFRVTTTAALVRQLREEIAPPEPRAKKLPKGKDPFLHAPDPTEGRAYRRRLDFKKLPKKARALLDQVKPPRAAIPLDAEQFTAASEVQE